MKILKKYDAFINEKWILGINESLFDKIEGLVKGKSDKGKIISELLNKNEIKTEGEIYGIWFGDGAEPGKVEMSNPIDYLHYTPGKIKINNEGVAVLTDEKSKSLQVPDTISFLAVMEKDEIAKNFTWGLKPGSIVVKQKYKFDLSKEIPTLSLTKETYSIPNQTWSKMNGAQSQDQTINLDEDISELDNEKTIISFKNTIKMITLQQWVDELNKTGWIKEDKKYFTDTMKFASDQPAHQPAAQQQTQQTQQTSGTA